MASLLDKAMIFVAEKLADVKMPEAEVIDVDLKDVSSECITYQSKVSVNNPYNVSIPICQVSYTFKSAGREIASGTMPDSGSLNENETTMLEVALKVPHNVLVTLVKDIGADWDIDYELELGLTIDLPVIGDFTIPISKKGEIKSHNIQIEREVGPAHERKFVCSIQIETADGVFHMVGDEKSRVKDAENSTASLMIRALQEAKYI